jgi:hypothetical protein
VKGGAKDRVESRNSGGTVDNNMLPFVIQAWVILFFQVGYSVFVPSMLWMIWQKVRHLPS